MAKKYPPKPSAATPVRSTPPQVKVAVTKAPPNPLIWNALSVVVLGLVTFVAFRGGFQNTFVDWDDNTYVKFNPIMQQPSWGHLGQIFSTSLALNYHPLTVLSMMLNALWFGSDNATSFVATNLLLHTLNVWLVFRLTQRLTGTTSVVVSFFTALLFAVHPLRVESVTWISERKDVLYTFFFLLACLSYLSYLASERRLFWWLTLLCFVLSCLSKAQAVVLPVVLMLLDWWMHRPWASKQALIQKIPFLFIAILFGVIALNIQAGHTFFGLIQPLDGQSKAIDLQEFSLAERLITGTFGFTMYLQKLFVPLNLTAMYPYERDQSGQTIPYYYTGLLVFPVVVVVALFLAKRLRYVFFGVAFCLITIVLVLQFLAVGTAIMADRYSYLPYFGLFFALMMGIDHLTRSQLWLATLAWTGVAGFAAWCTLLTIEQVKVWKDTGTLYSQRIKVYPSDGRALSVRGSWYGEQGRIDEAIPDLEKAIQMGVAYSNTFDNLGTAYGMRGQPDKALEMFSKAIVADSINVNARFNRGVNLMNSNPAQAIQDFEVVLRYSGDKTKNVTAQEYLAVCYSQVNRNDLALKLFDEIIDQAGSQKPQNYLNRGMLRQMAGNRNGAVADYQKVLQLRPDDAQARQLLSQLGVN